MELQSKLVTIQSELKAPKNQRNNFGNYNYRSCEDILEAVKPLLAAQGVVLTISDDIINLGDRYYVKATATVRLGTEEISVSACAREAYDQKGMQDSQLTGSTSSYARKYALNGLFAIDDTKDADSMDNTKKIAPRTAPAPKVDARTTLYATMSTLKTILVEKGITDQDQRRNILEQVAQSQKVNLASITETQGRDLGELMKGMTKEQLLERDVPFGESRFA